MMSKEEYDAIGSFNVQNKENVCEHLVNTKLQHNTDCENQTGKQTNGGLLAQSILAAVVTIAGVAAGMPIGYSAVLLPQLKSINGSLRIDDEMGSWIASVHSTATPVGAFLSGTLMDYLGRKTAIQLGCIPFIVGWICIGLCQDHSIMLIGRVLTGGAVSLTLAPCQVYIAEISQPNIRGVLASIPSASYIFGIFLIYVLGSIADWRVTAGLCLILPAVAAFALFFLPESPVWLVRQDNEEKANKACLWLRGGNDIQAKTEIQQLVKRREEEKLQRSQHLQSTWTSFVTPQIVKPFIIVNIFFVLQILTGPYLIIFYAVEIISLLDGENINEYLAAVLTAGVRFIFTIVASIFLAFIGRRALGLGSALGSAFSALSLATLLYFNSHSNSYLTAGCLLSYVAANTGLLTLPGVVIAEVFPMRVRGLAVGLTFTILNLLLFGVTKIFPLLKKLLSIHELFFVFGISSLVIALFIYCILPETKGKTLNEIEDYFLQDNLMWITRKKENKNKHNEND